MRPSQGLTPSVFWENKELLMNATRSELSELVKDVVGRARTTDSQPPTPVNKVDGRIILCAVQDLKALWPSSSEDESVYIIITGDTFDLPITGDASRILHISCNVDGKKGQGHFLQEILPRSDDFIRVSLAKGKRVWISCDTGKDVSVGVALVALQKYFDDDGKYNQRTVGSTGMLYYNYASSYTTTRLTVRRQTNKRSAHVWSGSYPLVRRQIHPEQLSNA